MSNKSIEDNQEFIEDDRELIHVDQYFLCEFVAIPRNFEIESVLKMRERMGIFDINGVDRKLLNVIIGSMRETPILQIMNNARLNITTALYILHIFQKCGIIIEDVINPFRQNYTQILESLDNKDTLFMRGQETKNLNLVIFNLDLIRRNNFGAEALKKCSQMEKYFDKINSEEQLIL
jgi:hypothetical protein